MICAALFGSLGRTEVPARLRRLADDDALREGLTWGLGVRLARRLGAGSREPLGHSRLELSDDAVTLSIDDSKAALATWPVTRDLEVLAQWLDREPKIQIGAFEFDAD